MNMEQNNQLIEPLFNPFDFYIGRTRLVFEELFSDHLEFLTMNNVCVSPGIVNYPQGLMVGNIGFYADGKTLFLEIKFPFNELLDNQLLAAEWKFPGNSHFGHRPLVEMINLIKELLLDENVHLQPKGIES